MQQKSNQKAQRYSSVFKQNAAAYNAGARLIIDQGGTSSSKTYSIIQVLVEIAFFTTTDIIISIVSESMPHLKRGCIRDFLAIMGFRYQESRWNKTDHIYTFPHCTMEFFSADEASKMRGGRRDILFINECNNITKEIFNELSIRTRKTIFLDYNPVSDFWAMELIHLQGSAYIHSTYLDARKYLPLQQVMDIESRRERDPNWWRIFGLGLVGNIIGLVHPRWTPVEALPEEGISFYGLDFGFTNDPSALVHIVIKGEEMYADECLYETGLTNQQLSKRLEAAGVRRGVDEIWADCAEPKSIAEIALEGWNIRPAAKGKDSVRNGIDRVNQFVQFVTKRSLNLIKELRNYRYVEDKDGKITNEPIDDFNHALDARRYAVQSKIIQSTQKVWPAFSASQCKQIDINWNMAGHKMLNYGAYFWAKDMKIYLLCALWDSINGILYVYNARRYDFFAEEIAFNTAATMNADKSNITRLLGNDAMFEEGRNPAMLLRPALRKAGIKTGPNPAVQYDEAGSIAYAGMLFSEVVGEDDKRAIIVEKRAPEIGGAFAGWALTDTNQLPESPLCNCLCLIVSELRRDIAKAAPKPVKRDYHPRYEAEETRKTTWMGEL